MKKILIYALLAATLCLCLSSCANEEALPQLPYLLIKREDHYIIEANLSSLDQEAYRLDIPEEVDGLPVVYVQNRGFFNATKLVILHVPGSVKQIDEAAFFGCTSLQKVTVDRGMQSLGSSTFASCPALREVTLPNTLTYMGWCVFDECPSLTEITFEGTTAEWEAVEKTEAFWTDSDEEDIPWYFGSAIKVVHCTDGDIAVGE